MNKVASPNRWYAPWQRSEAREEDDPAGYGTAFGLDLSMAPEAPAVLPPPPVVPTPRRSWMARLSRSQKQGA